MARGGARPGSGRKPGPRKAVVLGMNGGRRVRGAELPPSVSQDERTQLLTAPVGLSEAVRTCWAEHAPKALAERTLTISTAVGFRECCQQLVYIHELDARIQTLGAATKEAEPYLKAYVRLAQRLDASLKSFKLTAFGKPATSEKPKPAANPFAAFTRPNPA